MEERSIPKQKQMQFFPTVTSTNANTLVLSSPTDVWERLERIVLEMGHGLSLTESGRCLYSIQNNNNNLSPPSFNYKVCAEFGTASTLLLDTTKVPCPLILWEPVPGCGLVVQRRPPYLSFPVPRMEVLDALVVTNNNNSVVSCTTLADFRRAWSTYATLQVTIKTLPDEYGGLLIAPTFPNTSMDTKESPPKSPQQQQVDKELSKAAPKDDIGMENETAAVATEPPQVDKEPTTTTTDRDSNGETETTMSPRLLFSDKKKNNHTVRPPSPPNKKVKMAHHPHPGIRRVSVEVPNNVHLTTTQLRAQSSSSRRRDRRVSFVDLPGTIVFDGTRSPSELRSPHSQTASTTDFNNKNMPQATTEGLQDIKPDPHVDSNYNKLLTLPSVMAFLHSSDFTRLNKTSSTAFLDQLLRKKEEHDLLKNDENSCHERALMEQLIRIHKHAYGVVEHALAIKHWVKFQIVVQKVEGLSGVTANDAGIVGEVNMIYWPGEATSLAPLLWKPLSSHSSISYETTRPYEICHNEGLTPGRAISVRLYQTVGDSRTSLGHVTLPLSDVYQECVAKGEWRPIKRSMADSKISVEFQCLRVAADPKYVETKRVKACEKLHVLLGKLERWNDNLQDRCPGIYAPFGADVRLTANVSLLHAAVLLRDTRLVEKVLELGANVLLKSSVGTPIALAKKMSDGRPENGAAGEKADPAMSKILELLNDASDKEQIEMAERESRPMKEAIPDMDADTAPSSKQESVTEATLPRINPHWLLPEGKRTYLCQFFPNCCPPPAVGACRFVHHHPRLPYKLFDQLLPQKGYYELPMTAAQFQERVDVQCRRVFGQDWFTAGYSFLTFGAHVSAETQQIFYAQGGAEEVNDDGVSWYRSREEAIAALTDSMGVAVFAEKRGLYPKGELSPS